MGEPMRILLTTASVVLLAIAGWWSWSEWRASSEENDAAPVEVEDAS